CVNLIGSVLQAVQRVIRRCDSAAKHDLDVIRAFSELFTYCLYDFGHPICHDAEQGKPRAARAAITAFRPTPKVAVATRLADRATAHEQPRRFDILRFDGVSHAVVAASHVAYRSEATLQHPAQYNCGLCRHISRTDLTQSCDIGLVHVDMNVCI